MTAKDYPLGLPYRSTSPPYGTSALPYHRGYDIETPKGVAVVIDGVDCASTGETGFTFGPHLHIQEWKDSVFNTRLPQNDFKGGLVTKVSEDTNQQWGKHFIITIDGWNTTYCHLNSINVKVGQVIKGVEKPMVDRDAVTYLFRGFLDRTPTEQEYKNFIGKTYPDVLHTIYVSKEYKDRANVLQKYWEAYTGKDPKEVIKEVEKIVEKPVEVVKEVYTHDQATADNVSAIRNMVQTIFDYFSGQFKTFQKYIKK